MNEENRMHDNDRIPMSWDRINEKVQELGNEIRELLKPYAGNVSSVVFMQPSMERVEEHNEETGDTEYKSLLGIIASTGDMINAAEHIITAAIKSAGPLAAMKLSKHIKDQMDTSNPLAMLLSMLGGDSDEHEHDCDNCSKKGECPIEDDIRAMKASKGADFRERTDETHEPGDEDGAFKSLIQRLMGNPDDQPQEQEGGAEG